MFDFDDADIQSNSPKGNKCNSRSGRGNRSRGNSNLSTGGKSTPNDTPKLRKSSCKTINKALPPMPVSGVRWSCGSCTRLGVRPSNEDRLAAIPNLQETALGSKAKSSHTHTQSQSHSGSQTYSSGSLNSSNGHNRNGNSNHSGFPSGIGANIQERHGYFAVYDGHCGAQAAIHLQETLHFTIFNHPLYYTDLQTAIQESCVNTDIAFLEESRAKNQYSGTTALGAIVQGSELVVFNIGDCHAVLCCSGAALDMSDAHKPNRKDEAARILAARGWITEEKELYMARLHRMDFSEPIAREKAEQMTWTTIYRVCGEISVSRSIGDPDYKTFQPGIKKSDGFFIWPDGHDQVYRKSFQPVIFLNAFCPSLYASFELIFISLFFLLMLLLYLTIIPLLFFRFVSSFFLCYLIPFPALQTIYISFSSALNFSVSLSTSHSPYYVMLQSTTSNPKFSTLY